MPRHPSFESRILEYFETVTAPTGAVVLSIINEVARKRGFAPKRGVKVASAKVQRPRALTANTLLQQPATLPTVE